VLDPVKNLPNIDCAGVRVAATLLKPSQAVLAVMLDACRNRMFSNGFRMGETRTIILI